jgi:hypothetical protein
VLPDAGRGGLLKTRTDRVELRQNGLRIIVSLVPLTPAAAPPNRLALAQRREIDAVLVTELSRWGRSSIDLLATLPSWRPCACRRSR